MFVWQPSADGHTLVVNGKRHARGAVVPGPLERYGADARKYLVPVPTAADSPPPAAAADAEKQAPISTPPLPVKAAAVVRLARALGYDGPRKKAAALEYINTRPAEAVAAALEA